MRWLVIAGLQIATLMAGVMLVLMGVARMGGVIKFTPAPVVVGFTGGIAVIIFVGQWSAFLGLPQPEGAHFHRKLWHLLLFMAPMAADIPLAVLAAILFVVAWNMAEGRHFLRLMNTASRPEKLILVMTFVLTVFADLVLAVGVGVTRAVLLAPDRPTWLAKPGSAAKKFSKK